MATPRRLGRGSDDRRGSRSCGDGRGGPGRGGPVRGGSGRGDSTRRDGPSRGDRGHRDDEVARFSRFRIPWTRRVGVLGALTLLGASLVMASSGNHGGTGDRPAAADSPGASARPTTATGTGRPGASRTRPPTGGPTTRPTSAPATGGTGPTLGLPDATWTRSTSIDVPGTLPDGWVRRGVQRLRIFVDGRLARQVSVPASASFVVRGIPLKVGRHRIHATLRGPDGETQPSAAAVVIVDRTPPRLEIRSPGEGEVVNADQATVRGTLAGGDEVTVRNDATSAIAAGQPTADDEFSLVVPLGAGVNTFTVRGMDRAGNAVSQQLRVVRGEARPTASLEVSSETIRLARLPVRMTIRVTVRDADLRPVSGAKVTFTLSPPGLPTLTYRAESAPDGTASWERVSLTRDGAIAGKGFATAFVELPGGGTIQETAPFRFE